ncbi:MAG: hypothetical protein GY830_00380, partial [Bacteroidetes bacterium]|nr:hypothetical protein [Bacteroidota bacterium]
MSNNIKCGNSLINDREVAGDKAFDWDVEFKEIMDNGGFDVVIGNPPYVRADTENINFIKQRKWLDSSKNYETLYEKWDLMVPFYERSIKLLKLNGLHGFIVSNSITTSKYALKLQKWILKTKNLISINYFENIEVFKKVGVTPVITIIRNQNPNLIYIKNIHKNSLDNQEIIEQIFNSQDEIKPIQVFKKNYQENKLKIKHILLKNICYISYGLRPNSDERYWKGEFTKDDLISFEKNEINCKPFVEGKDLKRYEFERIKFLEWGTDRVPKKLVRPTFSELYTGKKILRGCLTEGVFDDTGVICSHGVIVFKLFTDLKEIKNRSIEGSVKKNNNKTRDKLEKISEKFNLKYLLSIINSKYANNFLNNIRRHRLKNYFYPDDFRQLPIPDVTNINQAPFIQKSDTMLDLNKQLQTKKTKFLTRIKDNLSIPKITKKLDTFYIHDFKTFISELKKQ